MYFEFFKDLKSPRMKLQCKSGDRTIFSYDQDVCDQFTKSSGLWWNKMYTELSELGHLPRARCPIAAGAYYIEGFTFAQTIYIYPTLLPKKLDLVVVADMYTKERKKLIHINRFIFKLRTLAKN